MTHNKLTAAEHIRRENALATHGTIAKAARALGLSVATLHAWRDARGFAVNHAERAARAVAALRVSRTLTEAAERCGVTNQAMSNRVKRHPELRALLGVDLPREEDRAVAALRVSRTLTEAAERCGLTRQAMSDRVKRYPELRALLGVDRAGEGVPL